MRKMQMDLATAEVVEALRDAGIPCILLKGPSTARWLYDPGELRTYIDIDLLVPFPRNAAGAVIEQQGFAPCQPETGYAWRRAALGWMRAADMCRVELHETFEGIRVPDDAAWALLATHREDMDVSGTPVPVLDVAGRALIVALHAAAHGIERAKTVSDLQRALERASLEDWENAASLARQLDAAEGLAAGLRLVPPGQQLADTLGLPSTFSPKLTLRATSAGGPPLAFERFATLRGLGPRVRYVALRLFPPPAYIRMWAAKEPGRPKTLAMGYASRLVWIARMTVPGLAAWRRARRAAPRSRRSIP
jgi:hypothetical protein